MSERPFIAWTGQGPVPIAGETVVDVQLRMGTICTERADFIVWHWCRRTWSSFDVIAYRLADGD